MSRALYDPVRRIHAEEGNYFYFPFGATKAENLLRTYVAEDETATVKVLLLGCADLRHVFHTAASSGSDQKIDFRLSNASKCVTARNVLFLHIVSSPKFRPESKKDLSFLWDIWYNFEWSKNTKSTFLEYLSDLESSEEWKQWLSSPGDVEAVRGMWDFWKQNIAACTRRVVEERLKARRKVFSGSMPGCLSPTSAAAQAATWYLGPDDSLQPGVKRFKDSFCAAATEYFVKGSLRAVHEATACLNPTLLQPSNPVWDVEPLASPLHSFYPIPNKEYMENLNILQYCHSVLGCRISAFRKTLEDQRIHVHFSIEDPLAVCWEMRYAPYDVIDTENLADEMGLANLLIFAPSLLRDHHSMLFTHSRAIRANETCQSYVSDNVGVPAGLIPAFFGLRLLDNLTFGCETPCSEEGRLGFTFRWGLPAITTSPKPTLDLETNDDFLDCINELLDRCFNEIDDEDDLLKSSYTPLTLGLIVRSMTTRFSFDLEKILRSVEVPEEFEMSWYVICHWLCGGGVVEYSHEGIQPHECLGYDGRSSTLGARPQLTYSSPALNLGPWYVETLQMVAEIANDRVQHFRVSFLVPDFVNLSRFDEGRLEIADVYSGRPLIRPKQLKEFSMKQFDGALPELGSRDETALSHDYFRIVSFTEQEESYRLVLGFKRNVRLPCNVDEIVFITDSVLPLTTIHEVRISRAGSDCPPLKVTFSCPVLGDKIARTYCQYSKRVAISFVKDVDSPWPEDFEKAAKNRGRLDVGCLPAWPRQLGTERESIKRHLKKQNTNPDELFPCMSSRGPQERIKLAETISKIFEAVLNDKQNFTIRSTGFGFLDGGLTFHVHPPSIRYSRQGTPLICVTVYDRLMASKLIAEKILDQEKAADDLRRLGINGEEFVSQVSPTGLNTLRRLLARNALLMEPSEEQKNLFPAGPNQPWIASYICPAYADSFSKTTDDDLPCALKLLLLMNLLGS